MKLTCKQFEELIPFYLNDDLSESLKKSFTEHLHNCPNCHIKFNMLNSIVNDLKDAYNQIIYDSPVKNNEIIDINKNNDVDEFITNLSAYIDNELNDDANIQIRRNIMTRPSLRKKVEELYSIRKLMTDSFNDEKNRLKTDYSKNIIRKINSNESYTESYAQCFIFIIFVICTVISSIILIKSLL